MCLNVSVLETAFLLQLSLLLMKNIFVLLVSEKCLDVVPICTSTGNFGYCEMHDLSCVVFGEEFEMNCNTMPKVQQLSIVKTAMVLLQSLWPFKFCCPRIPFYCGKILHVDIVCRVFFYFKLFVLQIKLCISSLPFSSVLGNVGLIS